jgi:hypothetical protein
MAKARSPDAQVALLHAILGGIVGFALGTYFAAPLDAWRPGNTAGWPLTVAALGAVVGVAWAYRRKLKRVWK